LAILAPRLFANKLLLTHSRKNNEKYLPRRSEEWHSAEQHLALNGNFKKEVP
jgi:hypothetical protein